MSLAAIERAARQQLDALRRYKVALTLGATVLVPALLAALPIFPDKIVAIGGSWLFWGLFGALVLIQLLLAGWTSRSAQFVQDLYFEVRDIDNCNQALAAEAVELKDLITRLSMQREQMQIWTTMQGRLIASPIESAEGLRQAIDEMLAALINERDTLFGFDRSELWNFAVYLAVEHSGDTVLKPVWRRRDDRHPSQEPGLGRAWTPGEGHVGRAFADRRPLITGDASHPDVVTLLQVEDVNRRSYDRDAYRSFASMPIGGGNRPLGILVATSDRPNRYASADDDAVIILAQAAQVLANVLWSSRQQISGWLSP